MRCFSVSCTCTVAACGPALLVYSAEKSGTTPMFETISSRSRGSTTRLTSASTRFTSAVVTSIRLPDGALTFITNWPASVRGKNATPRNG